MRFMRCIALIACIAGTATATAAVSDNAAALDGDYAYRTLAGDTLIGLCRRLLREPSRWQELQQLNHVERPRQMPLGTVLRIPYRWLRLTAESATVVAVAGDARAGGEPIGAGAHLTEGSVLDTGANGSVTLAMPDGSVVTMQKSSHLVLERLERIDGLAAHDASFRLTAGRLETHVQPQRDVGRFEIRTPVAVTAVRGTRFRATFDTSDADARTETLEGTVAVSARAAQVPVGSGFGTRVEHDSPPSAPVPLPPPPALANFSELNSAPDLVLEFAPVAGAARYRAQLAREQSFYSLVRDEEAAGPGLRIAGVEDGDYWLRVRSILPAGLEGPDAVYAVRERRAPAAPATLEPGVASNVPGRHVAFAWAPSPGAHHFAVQLARDAGFTDLVRDENEHAGARIDIDDIDPGTYYWRVAGVSAEGRAGPYSAPASFRQRGLAPQPAVTLSGRQAHVTWAGLGSDAYSVELAHDALFRYPIARATVVGDHWESPQLHSGDYYVRVSPRDTDGYVGAPGSAQAFHVPYPGWLRFAPLVLVAPFL